MSKNEFRMSDPLSGDLVASLIEGFASEMNTVNGTSINEATETEEEVESKEESEEVELSKLSEEELEEVVQGLIEDGELHMCPLCSDISEEAITEEAFDKYNETILESLVEALNEEEDEEDSDEE